MPQSLSKVILHVTFRTREREPWLDQAIRPRLHAYVATVCRVLGGDGLRVNGVSDHIHLATTLPRTLSQAEMIEQVKKSSSKWIKSVDRRFRGFSWQRSYAALSVSPSQLGAAINYLDAQEEHHRSQTFQEEYRGLLRRHGIAFDERYLRD